MIAFFKFYLCCHLSLLQIGDRDALIWETYEPLAAPPIVESVSVRINANSWAPTDQPDHGAIDFTVTGPCPQIRIADRWWRQSCAVWLPVVKR